MTPREKNETLWALCCGKPITINCSPEATAREAYAMYDKTVEYGKYDAQLTLNLIDRMAKKAEERRIEDKARELIASGRFDKSPVKIEKVIFNNPATIVFWNDGTKTVVKAQKGDIFDKEKGLSMAISKKYLGNTGGYFEEFKKWIV